MAYNNRGTAYEKTGEKSKAVKDFAQTQSWLQGKLKLNVASKAHSQSCCEIGFADERAFRWRRQAECHERSRTPTRRAEAQPPMVLP